MSVFGWREVVAVVWRGWKNVTYNLGSTYTTQTLKFYQDFCMTFFFYKTRYLA